MTPAQRERASGGAAEACFAFAPDDNAFYFPSWTFPVRVLSPLCPPCSLRSSPGALDALLSSPVPGPIDRVLSTRSSPECDVTCDFP